MVRITTILTTRIRIVACLLALLLVGAPLVMSTADDSVTPHWNKSACQSCHVDVAPTAGNLEFQGGDPEALCETCHGNRGDAKPCRHISGIPADGFSVAESHAASLRDGDIVCTTCHDLTLQCLNPGRSHSYVNPTFLRDKKSRNPADYCYQCHDASKYEKLNPHVLQAGEPDRSTCTLCHVSMPLKDEKGWISTDFIMTDNLNDICFGCHRVAPHPGLSFVRPVGWDHLAVPSQKVLDNMKRAEQTSGVIFPLDPNTGKMHCATCHNPHPETLDGYPTADTPGSKHRFRVDDICQACHDL